MLAAGLALGFQSGDSSPALEIADAMPSVHQGMASLAMPPTYCTAPAADAPSATMTPGGVASASSVFSALMGGSSAHNGSSTITHTHQSDIDESEISDDENGTSSSSSDGTNCDEEDEQVPLGTKVPSAEDLGLSDAAQCHIAEMNFADAQRFLWKLSHMSQYNQECVEVRLRVKRAVAAVKRTSTCKTTTVAQALHSSCIQGRVLFHPCAV